MKRSRARLLMLVVPFLVLLAGLGYLMFGGPKVVVRPLLPYESWHPDEHYYRLSPGHSLHDFLGHPIPFGARRVSPRPSGPERRLFLQVSKSVSMAELCEDLWIMSRVAQDDECRTTIIFTYD